MFFPLPILAITQPDDRTFMEKLYIEHGPLMYAQALKVLRSRPLAEDCVSDSLVALIKKIETLKPMSCSVLKAYVVITVKNTAINQLRKQRRQPVADVPLEIIPEPQEQDVERQFLSRVRMEWLKEAIRRLPPRESQALMMRYFQQLEMPEIAQAMGTTESSVRSLLSRGRKRLNDWMAKEDAVYG